VLDDAEFPGGTGVYLHHDVKPTMTPTWNNFPLVKLPELESYLHLASR
jgi:hypothetical protein